MDDAKTADGFDFGSLDIVVSDRYVLDEAVPPGSAPLAFVLAIGLPALAGVILVGSGRRLPDLPTVRATLPVPATTLGPGDRIPVRISGLVRTPTGIGHVREAPGRPDPVRAGPPIATATEPDEPAASDREPTRRRADVDGRAPGAARQPSSRRPVDLAAIATTLIVERSDASEGVALGLGELQRLSSGQVMTFRAPRPALRVVAGTGPLLLSFDTEAERDRAAAELLDESGFGPEGTPTRRADLKERDGRLGVHRHRGRPSRQRHALPRVRERAGPVGRDLHARRGRDRPAAPHTEDELYYVVAGRALSRSGGRRDRSCRARSSSSRRASRIASTTSRSASSSW